MYFEETSTTGGEISINQVKNGMYIEKLTAQFRIQIVTCLSE